MKCSPSFQLIESIARDELQLDVRETEKGNVVTFTIPDSDLVVAAALRNENLVGVNNPTASTLAARKDLASMVLNDEGFRVPQEAVIASLSNGFGQVSNTLNVAFSTAEKFGFPLILKPLRGSRARGVRFAKSREELFDAVLSHMEEFKNESFLLQEFVPGRQYRVVVFEGEVMGAYEHTGNEPIRVLDQAEMLPVKNISTEHCLLFGAAAEVLGLRYCGFDVKTLRGLETSLTEETVFIEANSRPDNELFLDHGEIDLVRNVYRSILLSNIQRLVEGEEPSVY